MKFEEWDKNFKMSWMLVYFIWTLNCRMFLVAYGVFFDNVDNSDLYYWIVGWLVIEEL